MFTLVLYILSLGLIWGAWGFWAMLFAIIAHAVVSWMFNPRNSYDPKWGSWFGIFAVILAGIAAVNDIWGQAAYTAAAIIIVAIVMVKEF